MSCSWRQLHHQVKQHIIKFGCLLAVCLIFFIVVYEIIYTSHLEQVKWNLKFAYNTYLQREHRKNIIIDKSLVIPEYEIIQRISKEQPNLAIDFWYAHRDKELMFNETCAPLPNIFKLQYVNAYWQLLSTPKADFHLYAAYFDNREENLFGPTIRILTMVNLKQADFPETYCQIWYAESKEPLLTKTFSEDYIWMAGWGDPIQGVLQPHLLTCILPEKLEQEVPQSVSLVSNACDAGTNLLKVANERPKDEKDKKNFAVCVKGISEMMDVSVALLEWIEWLKLVGVDKIFMYNLHIHPQLFRVLEHYQKENFVSITPLVLSGPDPNSPYLQYYFMQTSAYNYQFDLIAYNDCLLRNLYRFKYVIPLEINELLMPQKVDTLLDIFRNLSTEYEAYAVRKATFVKDFNTDSNQDVPAYLRFTRHVYRMRDIAPPGLSIRCFFNTKKMLLVHNHYPLKALASSIKTYDLEPVDIYLEQHVESCQEADCKNLKTFDSRKWHFKERVIKNVNRVLKLLSYI